MFLTFKLYIVMIIKILGTGCPKCKLLEQTTKDAIAELWINAEIIKVEDMVEIMQYDIMSTPGLVVDEKVVMTGKVPSKEELVQILPNLSNNSKENNVEQSWWCSCGGNC